MILDQEIPDAAVFLANVLPWPTDGDTFFVNVHRRQPMTDRETGTVLRDSKGKARQIYSGKACRTPREAVNHIKWVLQTKFDEDYEATGTDVYVCMSAQRDAKAKINQRGKTTYSAIRNEQNAVLFKGLWVDVDVKPGDLAKGYPDSETAVREFVRIYTAIGLPKPTTLVMSGSGGFHAHWVFQEAISHERWHPLAHSLVAALKENGFVGDTGCTIDAVRLLRVPGTFNYKAIREQRGPVLPVRTLAYTGAAYAVEFIEGLLAKWKGVVPPSRHTPTPTLLGTPSRVITQSSVDPSTLSEGVQQVTAVPIVKVAEVCPFVLRTLKTRGATNDNPLWLATTRLAMFTQEGKDAAHWMALGHPGYVKEDTDALYDRVEAERVQRNLGWPTCRNFHANGAPECATCPLLAANKSPLNHIKVDAPQPPAPPPVALLAPQASTITEPLPTPYSRDRRGCIVISKTDPDGNQFYDPISGEFPMLQPWIQDEPAEFNFTTMTAGDLGNGTGFFRQIKVPLESLYEKATFAKTLAKQHMVLPSRLVEPTAHFIMAWIETLRADRAKVIHSSPFGWLTNDQDQTLGFVYNKQVLSSGPPTPATNPDPQLDKVYSPQGVIEPWLAASKMITNQKRPELNTILASAFAAPLVRFTGQTGVMLSTYSALSGIGKSTALKVASSVWGDPIRSVQSMDDTMNAVIKKLSQLRHLPAYWDELKTVEDTEKFVQIVFRLSQGKEKSRLTSSTAFRETGSWETMLVSTSNDALTPTVSRVTKTTTAGVSRIFEFEVMPGVHGQISPAEAQMITGKLTHNFGHAGLMYAQFLGSHHEAVAKTVRDYLHRFEQHFKATTEERFWLALVVVLVVGATISNSLKLTEIDLKQLVDFLTDKFQRQRVSRTDQRNDLTDVDTLVGYLSQYLNERATRNTILTNVIHRANSRPPAAGQPGAVQLIHGVSNHLDEVQVHVATAAKELRMRKAPFMVWLDKQGISRALMMNALTTTLHATELRGRLGVGTPHATQIEPVIDFNYNDPAFKGQIDF